MHQARHPVAQVIEELATSVGMAVSAPPADVYYPSVPDIDDDSDNSRCGKTCMSIDSRTDLRQNINGAAGQARPITTHTVTINGAPDAPDGTPGLKAPNFARLLCRMIENVTGEHIGRYVLNSQGDRKFEFTHDDVTHGRSRVEQQLLAMKEKLLAKGNEKYLGDFKITLKLAQKMETAFSDDPKKPALPSIATRIVPTFRTGGQGVPILGLEIQTNHPQLKNQFTRMQNHGISNAAIPAAFNAVIAGDIRPRNFSGGRLIKAEGPSALAMLADMADKLIDPAASHEPPQYGSSASFGYTL